MNDPYRSETDTCPPGEPLQAPTPQTYRTPVSAGESSELEKAHEEVVRRRSQEEVYLRQIRYGSSRSKVTNFLFLLGTQVQLLSSEILEVILRLDERFERIEARLKKIEEERR